MKRRALLGSFASAASLALLGLVPTRGLGQGGPDGLTVPVPFDRFDPQAPRCSSDTGLSRTLAFVRDNDRDFIDGVDFGLSRAAAERQLDYVSVNADNSAEEMVNYLREMQVRQVGGLVTAPVDPMKSAPILQELLRAGTYVGTVVPPPATTILNAPQYLTGKVLAEAAATHIRDTLQGRANVVLLTHDSMQFLSPRFAAMRDVFREMPEVSIVADISPVTVTEKGGYDTMTTILIAEPQVDVVLGADTVVLGALSALREMGMARSDQFVGGIDGEPEAVAELSQPDSPYKTSISLASAIFGYAMGQHAADWIEGKSIPKAIDVLPFALTAKNVDTYKADMSDPGKVYANPARLATYLVMYGNTCIDKKDEYVNFPWSSETRF
jgi:ribose transport system substrate-binding protein